MHGTALNSNHPAAHAKFDAKCRRVEFDACFSSVRWPGNGPKSVLQPSTVLGSLRKVEFEKDEAESDPAGEVNAASRHEATRLSDYLSG